MANPQQLEKEVKEYEQKIEAKMKSIERLDRIYEEKNHQLYFLNNQIEGIDNQLKTNKVAGVAMQKAQFEQQQLVLEKSLEQSGAKLRKTFQNFFLSQKQKSQLQANKANIKMEVNSVAIYLMENPHDFVQNQWLDDDANEFKEGFIIPYKCATFLLKKTTTLGQIFEEACIYWGVSKSQYTLFDQNCNSLDLLHPYFAENFFSAHKETNPFAFLFIWRRNIYTNFLLDEQKKNIQITGKDNQNINQAEENLRLINQDLDNFIEVQPGLKLYQGQTKDENQQPSGSISIGWKVLLLLMSATYLTLLYINGTNAFNFKSTSQLRESIANYLMQTDQNMEMQTFYDIYEKIKYVTITDRYNSTTGLPARLLQTDEVDNQVDETQDEVDNQDETQDEVDNQDETQVDDGYTYLIRFQYIQMREYIRVFQVLTSEYQCNQLEILSNITNCTYAIYSNKDADKNDQISMDGDVKDWGVFKQQGVSGIQPFTGRLSDYDGGCFTKDYDSYSYANDKIDQNKQEQMFNSMKTKMIGIDLVFYDDSRQVFYVMYYYFEIAPSLEIIQQLSLVAYRINKFDATDPQLVRFNNFEYAQLALSGLLSFILMFISYKETYNKIKITKGSISIKRDFFEFLQLGFLYNFAIILMQVVSFIFFFQGPNSIDEIFNDGDVKNLMQFAQTFKSALIMRGLLIILVGFNTLKLYQISESVAFMQAMAAKGAENIAMITIFALTMLAAYSFIFFILFHQRLLQFTNYYKSFISVCSMFFMGNYRLWEKCSKIQPTMMITLTILIFITFCYGAIVLINAVLQEVYRTISYRTDHLQTINEFYAKIDEIKADIKRYLNKFITKIRGG